MRSRLVCFLLFLLIFSLSAADKSWVGGVSSNWCDGGNWTPLGPPEPHHTVEITNFVQVLLTGNVSVASLELRRATLVVSNQLTVTNLLMSENARISAWITRPSPVVAPSSGNGVVEIPPAGRLQFAQPPLGASVIAAFDGTKVNLRGHGFCTNRGSVLLFFLSQFNIYGTFEVTDDFNFDGSNGPPPGSVNNYGAFLRPSGTNLNLGSCAFTNRGTVRHFSGTMNIGSGANSGTMNISMNATQAYAGTPFFWEGGQFTGAGTVRLVRGSFEPGTNQVTFPKLDWTGTELRGTNTYIIQLGTWRAGNARGAGDLVVASGGSLALLAPLSASAGLERRLINFGKLTLETNASLGFLSGAAALINRGSFDLGNNSQLGTPEVSAPPPSKFLLNEWLLSCRAGMTNVTWLRFTNADRLRIDGQLTLRHSVSVQIAGETTVNGRLVTPVSAPYYVKGGVLEGNGVIVGRVRNGSTIAPGTSIGALTIEGSLTNGGAIEIELNDTSADQLIVTDHLRLGGRLNVCFAGSNWPADGATFEVLRFGTVSSNFYAMTGLDLGGGRVLQPAWSETNLVLTLTRQPFEKYRLQTVPCQGNAMELRFTVDPDAAWSIEASSDLFGWTSILTTNSPDGIIYFKEPMNLPQRFYRARKVQ